jgi:hypothetical protein
MVVSDALDASGVVVYFWLTHFLKGAGERPPSSKMRDLGFLIMGMTRRGSLVIRVRSALRRSAFAGPATIAAHGQLSVPIGPPELVRQRSWRLSATERNRG